jgi:hypothetical protein
MTALENLTPGGSEYVNDAPRCVDFIRQRQASQHQVILSQGRQLRAIRCFINEEREKVREMCAVRIEELAMIIRQLDLTQDLAPDTDEVSFVCTHCHNAGPLSECIGKKHEGITGPRCPRCDYCVQVLRKPNLAPSSVEEGKG